MKRFSIFLVLLLCACSAVRGTENAERGVARFRASYERAEFGQIYSAAHPDLKQATSQRDFLQLMEAIHRKMGKVKGAARTNANVNVNPSGTRVTLVYDTQFEQGAGVEQFVWRMQGDSARLESYNINSPVLILK